MGRHVLVAPLRYRRTLGLFLLGACLCVLYASTPWPAHHGSKPDWQVRFHPHVADAELSTRDREHLASVLKRTLDESESTLALSELGAALQKESPFARIHIAKTAPSHFTISLEKFRAKALARCGDAVRYVAEDGTVYGRSPQDEHGTLLLIEGLFSDREDSEAFAVEGHNRLVLGKRERVRIREALALTDALMAHKLGADEMRFVPYRGFNIKLAGGVTEVAFGRAPFKVKIEKLVKVLAHLQRRAETALRIELDYTDKVFVRKHVL